MIKNIKYLKGHNLRSLVTQETLDPGISVTNPLQNLPTNHTTTALLVPGTPVHDTKKASSTKPMAATERLTMTHPNHGYTHPWMKRANQSIKTIIHGSGTTIDGASPIHA